MKRNIFLSSVLILIVLSYGAASAGSPSSTTNVNVVNTPNVIVSNTTAIPVTGTLTPSGTQDVNITNTSVPVTVDPPTFFTVYLTENTFSAGGFPLHYLSPSWDTLRCNKIRFDVSTNLSGGVLSGNVQVKLVNSATQTVLYTETLSTLISSGSAVIDAAPIRVYFSLDSSDFLGTVSVGLYCR